MVIKPNSITSSSQVNITDREIIVLILEFLETKNLNISQVTLERETGIVNGLFSDELLFLRQLIFDGSWDDAVEYVEPLVQAPNFSYDHFRKTIYKYKYLELLCIKSEVGNTKFSDNAAISCLQDLGSVCDKNEFNQYRLLLSYQRIQDHPEYHDWNPSSARVKCFSEVRSLVDTVLQVDAPSPNVENHQSPPGRLVHLLIKGILYETAGRLCAQRAKKNIDDLRFTSLLPKSPAPPDMTLLSWLQVISVDVFTCQFEERNMPLNYQKFEKPLLEASWTEHIQQSPIRTLTQREESLRSDSPRVSGLNDRMVQSMVEQMDGFRRKTHGSASARQKNLSQSFHLGGLGQEDPFLSGIFAGSSRHNAQSARADFVSATNRSHLDGEKPSHLGIPDHREGYAEPLSPIHETAAGFEYSDPSPSLAESAAAESRRVNEESQRKEKRDEWKERDKLRDSLLADLTRPVACVHGAPTTPQYTAAAVPLVTCIGITPEPSSSSGLDETVIPKLRMSSETPVVETIKQRNKLSETAQRSAAESSGFHLVNNNMVATSAPASSRAGSSPDSFVSGKTSLDLDSGSRLSVLKEPGSALPVQLVEDGMFIRCAAFHPSGKFYAVGSNSKTLRICAYPDQLNACFSRGVSLPMPASIVDSRVNFHKGSIFCLAWNPAGDLLATGSNDKTIKLSRFNAQERILKEGNIEIRAHQDIVRDIIFMDDTRSTATTLMISGGADSKIYITDAATGTQLQRCSEHSGPVLSLHTWGCGLFVSGSQDATCRLWDIRTLSVARTFDQKAGLPDSAVTCARVDQAGQILVTAHESGDCCLWDLKGGRPVQRFRAHAKEIRGLTISPKSQLLLTASYDRTVLAHNMEDLSGNLFNPLPAVIAASHSDKVIQCHLHPFDKSFITTSADKTCVLWGYPEESQ